MTGVLPGEAAALAAGLDDCRLHTAGDGSLEGCFGFDGDELRRLCAGSGARQKIRDAAEWYGYSEGGETRFSCRGVVEALCGGSGEEEKNTALLEAVMQAASEDTLYKTAELLRGGSVTVCLAPLSPALPLPGRCSAAMGLLQAEGMLEIESWVPQPRGERLCRVRLANKGAAFRLRQAVLATVEDLYPRETVSRLLEALHTGSRRSLEKAVTEALVKAAAAQESRGERFYACALLGMAAIGGEECPVEGEELTEGLVLELRPGRGDCHAVQAAVCVQKAPCSDEGLKKKAEEALRLAERVYEQEENLLRLGVAAAGKRAGAAVEEIKG